MKPGVAPMELNIMNNGVLQSYRPYGTDIHHHYVIVITFNTFH
jgi:hypothetical protein